MTDEIIIDVNGQKYRAYWDEYGYLAIEAGEMFEGEFHSYDPGMEGHNVIQLDPTGAEALLTLIEEGR